VDEDEVKCKSCQKGGLENRTVENRTVSGINGHKSSLNKYPEIILKDFLIAKNVLYSIVER
jgi:hypothetical protein